MLIPLLSPLYLFTGSSRVKKLSHISNKVSRKDKRGTRATLIQNEEGEWVQFDRGAAAREAAEKRAEEEFLEQERAKKARYDNLMRKQPFFDMPQNSTNPLFWRGEQELVYRDVLCQVVGPQHSVHAKGA